MTRPTTTTSAVTKPHEDPNAPLVGKQFAGVSATQGGAPYAPVDAMKVTFRRDETRDVMTWTGGCNIAGAPLRVQGDRLIVNADEMTSTLAGCPEDVAAREGWLTSLMRQSPLWQLDGSTLTLRGGDQQLVLHQT